jgi:hypothetical protein
MLEFLTLKISKPRDSGIAAATARCASRVGIFEVQIHYDTADDRPHERRPSHFGTLGIGELSRADHREFEHAAAISRPA